MNVFSRWIDARERIEIRDRTIARLEVEIAEMRAAHESAVALAVTISTIAGEYRARAAELEAEIKSIRDQGRS